jgi:hypothetical protein
MELMKACVRQSFAKSFAWAGGQNYGSLGSLNGREDLVVGWKAVRILLGDAPVADPDRELATAAFDQLGLDPGLVFNERRRTDSAREVVSDPAVPNPDIGHPLEPSLTIIRTNAT